MDLGIFTRYKKVKEKSNLVQNLGEKTLLSRKAQTYGHFQKIEASFAGTDTHEALISLLVISKDTEAIHLLSVRVKQRIYSHSM